MIYFTSDTHFGHANIIKYLNRPFSNSHEMDKILIRNWNLKVSAKDTIYHLGDFGMGPPRYLLDIINRLNGHKFLISGSHDKRLVKELLRLEAFHLRQRHPGMTSMGPMYVLKGIKGVPDITLCHYSMRVWPKAHYGTFHLFDHSHGHLEGVGKSFDVGVDANNFKPVSLDEVVIRMEAK